jgi:hypothetical protein
MLSTDDQLLDDGGSQAGEPLPFDFVDFVCAVRRIRRDLALELLREFVAGQRCSERTARLPKQEQAARFQAHPAGGRAAPR